MNENTISIREDGVYWEAIMNQLGSKIPSDNPLARGLVLFAVDAVAKTAQDLGFILRDSRAEK